MSIFDTSSMIAAAVAQSTPNTSQPQNVVIEQIFQAVLTYGSFYTGGPTFNGTAGKFVQS